MDAGNSGGNLTTSRRFNKKRSKAVAQQNIKWKKVMEMCAKNPNCLQVSHWSVESTFDRLRNAHPFSFLVLTALRYPHKSPLQLQVPLPESASFVLGIVRFAHQTQRGEARLVSSHQQAQTGRSALEPK